MLSDAITTYLEMQRAAGFKYKTPAKRLRSFAAFAEERGDIFIRAETVLDWAALSPSDYARRQRLLAVRRAALFLHAEQLCHEVPPADALGCSKAGRRSPYIYTPDEIARLMAAAAGLPPEGAVAPLTYVTLFGVIAATGLRISEALALLCADITGDGMLIQNTKFRKSRIIPLHDTVRRALNAYLVVRMRQNTVDEHLFTFTSGRAAGRPLPYPTVRIAFSDLIRTLGLHEQAGRRQPRIHDLRHTFAVRSIEQCRHDQTDVARHILALSTYLGHASVTNTYWYLQATPTLMTAIAEAGETLHQRGVP
jgi:integrase